MASQSTPTPISVTLPATQPENGVIKLEGVNGIISKYLFKNLLIIFACC